MNRCDSSVRALAPALFFALGVAACAPKFDWREVRPEGSGLSALFPCKPTVQSRGVPLAEGATGAAMGLAVCRTDEISFSVAWADVSEPAQVGAALLQMRESLLGKLQVQPEAPQPVSVAGMTPNSQALQQSFAVVSAKAPARYGTVAVFTRGVRVYQLVMLGARPGTEASQAWETLVGAIKLES